MYHDGDKKFAKQKVEHPIHWLVVWVASHIHMHIVQVFMRVHVMSMSVGMESCWRIGFNIDVHAFMIV